MRLLLSLSQHLCIFSPTDCLLAWARILCTFPLQRILVSCADRPSSSRTAALQGGGQQCLNSGSHFVPNFWAQNRSQAVDTLLLRLRFLALISGPESGRKFRTSQTSTCSCAAECRSAALTLPSYKCHIGDMISIVSEWLSTTLWRRVAGFYISGGSGACYVCCLGGPRCVAPQLWSAWCARAVDCWAAENCGAARDRSNRVQKVAVIV